MTRLNLRILLLITTITLFFALLIVFGNTVHAEKKCLPLDIDARGFVKKIYSIDSIDITVIEVWDPSLTDVIGGTFTVKLAGVELKQGVSVSVVLDELSSLLEFSPVYIDVVSTGEGKVFPAIIYVPLNETHVLNVNEYMIEKGLLVFNRLDVFGDSVFCKVYKLYEETRETLPEEGNATSTKSDFQQQLSKNIIILVIVFLVLVALVIITMML